MGISSSAQISLLVVFWGAPLHSPDLVQVAPSAAAQCALCMCVRAHMRVCVCVHAGCKKEAMFPPSPLLGLIPLPFLGTPHCHYRYSGR